MSTLLGASLDCERTLTQIARLAVPALGDLCAIDVLRDDGVLHRVAGVHVEGSGESFASDIEAWHAPAAAARELAAMLGERRPVLVSRATRADLDAVAPSADPVLRRLAPKSWIVAPLIAADRVRGAVTLAITRSTRRYRRTDLAFATVVASQAAAAIEGARLRREVEAARGMAEAANRSRDEALSTLSHELRNPLNAVHGWATLIERGQLGEAQTRRAVQIIVRNVNAQIRIVDDVLAMSRIATGHLRLSVEPVDLRDAIENGLEAVRHAAEAKGIRLRPLPQEPGLRVSGDAGRLQQVVWNLLENAVKFTPNGGRIEVRLRRARSHVEIVVSDTGEGIAADVLPYIFERARQPEGGDAPTRGGLGIGLALVRHLVELHGGSVCAESAGEGHGATFVVQLPLMPAEPRERPIASPDGAVPDGPLLRSSVSGRNAR
jgi:signal transduction histidine kinase